MVHPICDRQACSLYHFQKSCYECTLTNQKENTQNLRKRRANTLKYWNRNWNHRGTTARPEEEHCAQFMPAATSASSHVGRMAQWECPLFTFNMLLYDNAAASAAALVCEPPPMCHKGIRREGTASQRLIWLAGVSGCFCCEISTNPESRFARFGLRYTKPYIVSDIEIDKRNDVSRQYFIGCEAYMAFVCLFRELRFFIKLLWQSRSCRFRTRTTLEAGRLYLNQYGIEASNYMLFLHFYYWL